MSLFTYEPLNVRSTDIRLVEILATENWSDPLELKLIHTSLTRPPEYLTLSYTWGAPFNGLCPEWNEENATIPIKLNNGVFYARWNLESALRHLRSYNWDTKLIWIDAIRIDQENSDEKAHQIILMKDIYAKSRMTVIWLGPATADSFGVMRKLFQLSTSWDMRSESVRSDPLKAENHAEYEELLRRDILGADKDILLGISRLFLRSWWSQAWVVQELVVSPTALLCCGSAPFVPWRRLSKAYEALLQYLFCIQHFVDEGEAFRLGAILNFIRKAAHRVTLLQLFFHEYREDAPLKLPDALWFLKSFFATNERDKVYAALGLVGDAFIMPSYDQDVATIYYSACRNWIERHRDLHILDYCYLDSSAYEVPSWVPDWSNTGQTDRWPLCKRSFQGAGVQSPQQQQVYRTSAGHSLNVEFGDEQKTLKLSGVLVDVIDFIGNPHEPPQSRLEGSTTLSFEEEQYREEVHKMKDDIAERKKEVFEHTWLEEWFSKRENILHKPCLWAEGEGIESSSRNKDFYKKIYYKPSEECLLKAFYRTIASDVYLNEDMSYRGRITQASFDWIRYTSTVGKMLMKRTFDVSSAGFIGIAPEESQVGDIVFIILGNETPFLVRGGKHGAYRFVGECYIHGIMDGDLADNDPTFSERVEEIIIS